MKYLVIVFISLFLLTGCVLTKMIIPDVQTRMSNNELTHKAYVATKTQDQLSKIEIQGDKGKLGIAKLIAKAGKDADDIAPSTAENLMQQYIRTAGQGALDEQLDAGFQWTTQTISQLAGGATGTGIISTLLLGYLRKRKALNVVNSELSSEEKAKVKKAMNYTGLERQIV